MQYMRKISIVKAIRKAFAKNTTIVLNEKDRFIIDLDACRSARVEGCDQVALVGTLNGKVYTFIYEYSAFEDEGQNYYYLCHAGVYEEPEHTRLDTFFGNHDIVKAQDQLAYQVIKKLTE